MRPRSATARATLAALSLLGAGCGSRAATGLFVVVDADPRIALRVGSVRVQIFTPGATNPIDQQDFPIGPRYRFPISFGVTPRDGSTQVRVEVTGLERVRGNAFVFARAATRYVEGRVPTLPLTLWGACADQPACPTGTTCNAEGVCDVRGAIVDPSTLPEYAPGADSPCPGGLVRALGMCVAPPDAARPSDGGDADVVDATPADVPSTDTGADTGADARTDSGTDSGGDSGTDSGTDSGVMDVAVDATRDVPTTDVVDAGPADVRGADLGSDVGSAPDVAADATPDVAADAAPDAGPPCPTGRVRCAASCVDLTADRDHCGACGRACSLRDACTQSQCGHTVINLAAGLRQTCAALHDGSARCWGGSATNDLANGDLRAFSTPQFAATPIAVREVGAGTGLGCVRHGATNRVTCWGDNDVGAVGAGVTGGAPREASVEVSLSEGGPLTGVRSLALHAAHVCALREDGTVRCWGANGRGQLGDGAMSDRASAVSVTVGSAGPLTGVVSIAVSVTASYAVTATGRLYAWGGNASRELGSPGFTASSRPRADEVTSFADVRRVYAGGANACVIVGDSGSLYCWGANDSRQLGAGSGPQNPRLMSVGGAVTGVAIGQGFICALLADGTVRCLGANRYGQLGDGTRIDNNVAVSVSGLSDATAIVAGTDHACALRAGNVVSCWGSDRLGQVGSGRTLFRATPEFVPLTAGTTRPVALEGGTCVRRPDNSMICWGANSRGELGDGTILSRGDARPVLYSTGSPMTAVRDFVGGAASACARVPGTGAGLLVCWGANDDGVLGLGTSSDERYPQSLTGLPDVGSMALRYSTACAVHGSGMLSCWGRNTHGQAAPFISGPSVNSPQLLYGSGTLAAAPGLTHTCALRTDGSVLCFGSGDRGELGDGTLLRRDAQIPMTPLLVSSASPVGGGRIVQFFASIASGVRFSCGITVGAAASGGSRVYCWGANTLGQLGRGTADTAPHSDAAPVLGLPVATIDRVVVGGSHACAVTGQAVYCWGDATFGATGTTASTPTLQATRVAAVARAVDVTAGSSHTCALDSAMGLFCWGLNIDNQLGSATPMFRATPLAVAGLP